MRKSDEMIFVLSLYNKIKDTNPELKTDEVSERLFKACKNLIAKGELHPEACKDCAYALFPKERQKIIDKIKEEAISEIEAVKSPYSRGVDEQTLQQLIDEVLHDKPSSPGPTEHSVYSGHSDPCSSSCINTSRC